MVQKALSKLRPDKGAGPDNLSARFLHEVSAELCTPLVQLFEKSIKEGTVPDD
jgi:hypothetical protein